MCNQLMVLHCSCIGCLMSPSTFKFLWDIFFRCLMLWIYILNSISLDIYKPHNVRLINPIYKQFTNNHGFTYQPFQQLHSCASTSFTQRKLCCVTLVLWYAWKVYIIFHVKSLPRYFPMMPDKKRGISQNLRIIDHTLL